MVASSNHRVLPAEWHPQSAIMLTWPHNGTDWAYMMPEVEACFINIANEILKHQRLLVVCSEQQHIENLLGKHPNLITVELPTNDTWARDHGAITIFENGKPILLDFQFNGWGLKFASHNDNLITKRLFDLNIFANDVALENCLNVTFEGGGIESDGKGTLLTTAECLLSPNRNGEWSKAEIENYLEQKLGAKRVLWLNYGYLSGDDTDSHVDTLARFIDEDSIAYVQCTDTTDEHYNALFQMEQELKSFVTNQGTAYNLVPLPMVPTILDEDDNHRLPATYANFLIINQAVLLPIYNCSTDELAIKTMERAMPNHKIVPIDCTALIRQHGSLHCVTMQFPKGIID